MFDLQHSRYFLVWFVAPTPWAHHLLQSQCIFSWSWPDLVLSRETCEAINKEQCPGQTDWAIRVLVKWRKVTKLSPLLGVEKRREKNTDKPCLKLRILCSSIPPRTFAARQHINTKTNRDIFRARPSPDMKWDVASSWSCTAFIWEWILLSVNCDFNLYLNAFLSCKSLVLWQ